MEHPYPKGSIITSMRSWTRHTVVSVDEKAKMYVCEDNLAVAFKDAHLSILPPGKRVGKMSKSLKG